MKETLQKNKLNSVLLVDDNEFDLLVAEKTLARKTNVKTIHRFTKPAGALALLRNINRNSRQFPEFILLDVKMPVINAFGFLEKAEQLGGFTASSCRVVLISSYLNYFEGPEIMEKAKNHSCIAGFIEKPFTIEKLAELA